MISKTLDVDFNAGFIWPRADTEWMPLEQAKLREVDKDVLSDLVHFEKSCEGVLWESHLQDFVFWINGIFNSEEGSSLWNKPPKSSQNSVQCVANSSSGHEWHKFAVVQTSENIKGDEEEVGVVKRFEFSSSNGFKSREEHGNYNDPSN